MRPVILTRCFEAGESMGGLVLDNGSVDRLKVYFSKKYSPFCQFARCVGYVEDPAQQVRICLIMKRVP